MITLQILVQLYILVKNDKIIAQNKTYISNLSILNLLLVFFLINFKKGATRKFFGRSLILVLLSSKHAYLRSFDGIWCISAGMIPPKNTILLVSHIV